MFKYFITEYFSFTRKERRGIAFLVLLILVAIFLPLIYPYYLPIKKYDHASFEKELATLRIKRVDSSVGFQQEYKREFFAERDPASFRGSLFKFDPNQLPAAEWKKLGVRDKTIQTIQNYLSKGGRFRKAEDLGKIWGLPPALLQKLEPFVDIRAANNPPAFTYKRSFEKKSFAKSKYDQSSLDINLSDTTEWIALPGIGSKLANRIIQFRERLGGFYSIDQVGETFALPDSTFRKIKSRLTISAYPLKQLNINTAGIDEMKQHPYIRYHLANAIFQYRVQHGNYTSVDDIKQIMILKEEVYKKLYPYLVVR